MTVVLHAVKKQDHLDYHRAKELVLPLAPTNVHVVIDGPLPQWLIAAIAQAYTHCAGVTCAHGRE